MYIYMLFCLLAVAQANPLHPHVEAGVPSHIVIVTPQAQVHLEPAVRYVHGLSPLARVGGPHRHEETVLYVPAGSTASVVPLVEAVGSGRASAAILTPETKQIEQISQNIEQIQQQVQQGAESWGGQLSEASNAAAAAAASAGSGFFPSLYPPVALAIKKEDQKLKAEYIETPANTQPLLATESRHFYSLPQVYHTPVIDVVQAHAPVFLTPISTIRARSIKQEAEPGLKLEEPQPYAEAITNTRGITPEAEQPLKAEELQPIAQTPAIQTRGIKAEAEAEPVLKIEEPLALPAALPLQAQPLLKEQQEPQPQLKEQQLQPLAEKLEQQTTLAAAEPLEQKAEITGRLLEANALKQELQYAELAKDSFKEEIKESIKESIKEEIKPLAEELIKSIPAEPQPIAAQPIAPQPIEQQPIAAEPKPIIPQA